MATHMAMNVPVTTVGTFGLQAAPRDIALAISVTTTLSIAPGFTADTTDRGSLSPAGQGHGRGSGGTATTGTGRTGTGSPTGAGGRGSPVVPTGTPLLLPDTVLTPDTVLSP